MPNDSDPASSTESGGEGGGLYRQLLGGLENFRWLLVKSAVAVAIGMVICLVGANYLVRILEWPLRRGESQSHKGEQQIVLQLGTNQFFRAAMPTNFFGAISLGTNHVVSFRLVPLNVATNGTNFWLGIQPGDPVPDNLSTSDRLLLKTLGPLDAFTVAIDLAIYGGIALAAPFIFFFFGQFVLPFLKRYKGARQSVVQLALIMSGLFVAGVLFCYFVLLPLALGGSIFYARWMNFVADTWKADEYIGFVCKFCLGMGVGFQLPVVLLTLVRMGVLNYERLVKFRVYWLVINLVLSAVITPDGNPLTMLLMAAPLQVLFEVSIWIARYWQLKERKAQPAES